MTENKDFEPKIIAFLCNWCSYAGADLAGVSREQYPPNILNMKVMCSSRVSPEHIFDSFQKGADGVLIAGCHPGDCHYIDGNYKTIRKTELMWKMLEDFGIDPHRLR
ncbi:MAG: hydrogenase iron-sulfur subunit, partial [Candidatus Natronoplasma sp.]